MLTVAAIGTDELRRPIMIRCQVYQTTAEQLWPDKAKIAARFSQHAEQFWQRCPSISVPKLFERLIGFGGGIERATTPQACAEEFFDLLRHLASPEPGGEGLEVSFEH